MSLSEAERTDVRRFCGYPAIGRPDGSRGGWQYYQSYGQFEFRLGNLSESEIAVVRRYLGSLTVLELAIPRSGDQLDTDQASVWTRNKDEPRDRARLFDDWRRRLCDFLGVPPGRGLSTGAVAWVV